MSTLSLAKKLAKKGHQNQFDQAGKPYILHPYRVMDSVDSELEKIVAVLHDLFEDTKITAQQLKKYGFDNEVIRLLIILTRNKDESYMAYIQRIALDPIAIKIKLADLKDNMDASRVPNELLNWHQNICKNRYQKAKNYLENALLQIQPIKQILKV